MCAPVSDVIFFPSTNMQIVQEVDDQIARGDMELNDEVEMKLTDDEQTAHSNAWRTHRETTESLK